MSMRAHPAAIGAFVVGAVALLLVALLVWGGTDLFRTKLDYVLFFDAGRDRAQQGRARPGPRGQDRRGDRHPDPVGDATGRGVHHARTAGGQGNGGGRTRAGGSSGSVREEGLRAQLRMQSFVTGVLYVALDFRPDTPIVLRGRDEKVPELPTVPTDIEVWTAKLERFADKIEKVPLDQIGQTTAVILEEVKKIVESKATHDLFPNTNAAISDARTLVRRVDAQIDPLFAQLKGTLARFDAGLDAARKLALDVDSRVDPLANQAEAALKVAQAAIADVRPLIEDLRRLAAKLDAQADPALTSFRSASDSVRATMERAQLTLGGVDQTLEQGSPLGYELFQTLKELRAAALALRSLADYLERVPDAMIYGVRRPSGGAK